MENEIGKRGEIKGRCYFCRGDAVDADAVVAGWMGGFL